jgi:putative transposase
MLDEFCFKAKNLYNAALYRLREAYFGHDAEMTYESLDKALKREGNIDYSEMPMASSAQWTLKAVCKNWKSFWASIKAYSKNPEKFLGKPKMPCYLHKTQGRSIVYLTNQNVKVKDGVLHFPKCFDGFSIPTELNNHEIQQVRIVPKNRHFAIEIVYQIDDVEIKADNSRYVGVDLGLDNFATVASNDGSEPILINGKGLKSLNKHWNKRISHLKEVETAMNGHWVTTKTGKAKVSSQTAQQIILTNKRNNQVKDFCHKSSRMVIELAIERNCNTIVVGKNDGWKQESKMSKNVNQSFIQIPHAAFINMLEYKCRKNGLNFVSTEEAHTSKTSWIDGELPKHHENYAGKRIKRGLFESANGNLINADVNGALQIVRKVFPKAKADGIWAYGQPVRVNV